jgi:membrane associated rhomboid family serine protease
METLYRNVLGGNFALIVAPSVGASGAIFGTIGVCIMFNLLFTFWHKHIGYLGGFVRTLVNHLQAWPEGSSSYENLSVSKLMLAQLAFQTLELIIGVLLGYIPCELPCRPAY